MGVPKRKTSKSKRDKRRTHDNLTVPTISLCPQCHEAKHNHYACKKCGYYNGREVIPIKETT